MPLSFIERRRNQRRPDRARCHPVHANPFLGEVLRERARERDDRSFRGGIVQQFSASFVCGYRSGVDDDRAFLQVFHRGFREEKHREDVRAERPLELLCADVLDRLLRVLLGGIVHQDVELDQLGRGALHQLLAERFVTNITRNDDASACALRRVGASPPRLFANSTGHEPDARSPKAPRWIRKCSKNFAKVS